MSYILDAIRKAEEERLQRQNANVRSLAVNEMPLHTQSRGKYWLGGAIVVIALNVVLWMTLSNSGTAIQENRSLSTETKVTIKEEPTERAPLHAVVPTTAESQTNESELQRLKLWQADAQAQTAINALDFSFHVYSTDASHRTIVINKQRMREGERISESMVLNEITPTGVLLAFENALVDVEVLEQW